MMLNTLPFPRSDFGGTDVRHEYAAQSLPMLAAHIDRFELMTYLQILNRPDRWLRTAVEDARSQLPADKQIVCTLQVSPLYVDGVHADRRRARNITAEQLDRSSRAALDAGADGLVYYHWTDLLMDEADGGRKRQTVRAIAHGG